MNSVDQMATAKLRKTYRTLHSRPLIKKAITLVVRKEGKLHLQKCA